MVAELAEKGFANKLSEVPPRLREGKVVRAAPRGHVFVGGAEEGVGEGVKFAGVDGVDEMLVDEIVYHAGRRFALVDGADVVGGIFPDGGETPAQCLPGRDDGACHKLRKIFS